MFQSIAKNKVITFTIVAMVGLFLAVIVYFVANYFGGGVYAVPFAVGLAIISTWTSYFFSDKIILTISGARPADRDTDKKVREAMEGLCIASGLPMPKVYIIEDNTANAFATGRNPQNAVVAVTTGLLQKLDYYELEGVLAHELAHIGNRDILLSAIVTVMIGIAVILSDFFKRIFFFGGRTRSTKSGGHPIFMLIGLILLVMAPIAGMLMRMALSRNRVYLADATAIEFTRNPDGLIGALRKLSTQEEPVENASNATSHLYIVNPFETSYFEAGKGFSGLFSTYPPIEKRIQALRNL